jgi:serine/threonine protein kinase
MPWEEAHIMSVYRQGEVLGIGTFAQVFEGWDALLERSVAIKVLVPPFAAHDAFVRAYLEKAVQLLDVSHENLLVNYPLDHGQNPPALVRELAPQTVESLLIGGPLAPEEIEELLRQMVAGLGVIHRRGLVHGAVKPQNIFCCGDRYKLGDFGPPAVEGAPPVPARQHRYSPPEALLGESTGPASDLYSLGIVAYELTLGPLRLERLIENLAREAGLLSANDLRGQRADEVWPRFHAAPIEVPALHEIIPGFPMALAMILHQMIRHDASARFGDGEQLLASLGPAVARPGAGDEPSRRRPPGHTPESATALDRRPSGSAAGPALGASPSSGAAQKGKRRSAAPAASGRVRPALQGAAGALAVALLAGGGWLAIDRFRAMPQRRTAVLEPQCPPTAIDMAADPTALAERLRAMSGAHPTLQLELDPPAVRLPVGSPIRFQVSTGRSGHLLLFALSSDGVLTSFYPNPMRGDLPLSGGSRSQLPLPEDQRVGFDLKAGKPLGRDIVFALRSDFPLLPPPGRDVPPWSRVYPPFSGEAATAREFVSWVGRTLCDRQQRAELAVREIEVVR